ncbi:hypothetical protein SKAU_G00333040 [Synaphobranchus kaupii]|uniref:Uncharacterized protein n=1 Tax=Synaphobranchus kaupii TaxID=118154 RepID=A0A9Q1ELI4_SYNKA|nr:hypothetical protein SKAU_G00333040 [Synaphobranchus kaupii]
MDDAISPERPETTDRFTLSFSTHRLGSQAWCKHIGLGTGPPPARTPVNKERGPDTPIRPFFPAQHRNVAWEELTELGARPALL